MMETSMERVSDSIVNFHLYWERKRFAVWQRIRGNRTLVSIIAHDVKLGSRRIGMGETVRLIDIGHGTEISEWEP